MPGPNIPSLNSGVDPSVRRAINALKNYIVDSQSSSTLSNNTLASNIPPQPQGFRVIAIPPYAITMWEDPRYDHYNRAEVFSSAVDDLSTAVLETLSMTQIAYISAIESDGAAYTNFYWVRFVSDDGRRGPFNATAGTQASALDFNAMVIEDGVFSVEEKLIYKLLFVDMYSRGSSLDVRVQNLGLGGSAEYLAWSAVAQDILSKLTDVLGITFDGDGNITGYTSMSTPTYLFDQELKEPDVAWTGAEFIAAWDTYVTATKALTIYVSTITGKNEVVAEISSDGIFSVVEKSQYRATWENLVSEANSIIETSTALGITGETVYTGWLALGNQVLDMMTLLWGVDYADFGVSTAFADVGLTRETFDTNWDSYFYAKQQLLDFIAGFGSITNEQAASITALNAVVASVSNDGLFDIFEKQTYQSWWEAFQVEYYHLDTEMLSLSIDRTDLTAAAVAVGDIVGPMFADMANPSVIADRTAFDAAWNNLFVQKQLAINAVAAAGGLTPEQIIDREATLETVRGISDDGFLSVVEKQQWLGTWEGFVSEAGEIDASAIAFGLTGHAAYTDWSDTRTTLYNYMTPLWADMTQKSAITRSTFNANWSNYLTARQRMLNVIALSASTTANWSGVSGPGKPADYADVTAHHTANDTAKVAGVAASTVKNNAAAGATFTSSHAGLMAYEDAVELAKLGTTVVQGGYVATGLVKADRIAAGTLNAGVVYAGVISADQITAGTFTGRVFRSAASGERIEITNSLSSLPHKILGYNNFGTQALYIDTDGNCTFDRVSCTDVTTTDGINVTGSIILNGVIYSPVNIYYSLAVGSGSYFQVDGSGNITGRSLNLGATGDINCDQISAKGLNLNSGSISSATNITASGTISGGSISATNVYGAGGSITSGGVQTSGGSISTAGAIIGTSLNVSSGSASAGSFVVGSAVTSSGVVGRGTNVGGWFDGSTSGHDVYLASSAVYAFTGAHEGIIPDTIIAEVGDIMVDAGIVNNGNIFNCIGVNVPSSMARQTTVFGVYTGQHKLVGENETTEGLIAELQAATSAREFFDVLRNPRIPSALHRRDYQPADNSTFSADRDLMVAMIQTHSVCNINALGEGMVNVCPEGGNIAAGDYICSSSTVGKGMRQDDDLLHSYTVAKARESVTWTAEEIAANAVKMVACTYHCG